MVTYDEGRMTQTFLNKRPEVQSVFERKGWSQRGIDFSPTGKFVSTYHEQGIALWVYTPHLVGASESKAKGVWSRSHKFRHDQVLNPGYYIFIIYYIILYIFYNIYKL